MSENFLDRESLLDQTLLLALKTNKLKDDIRHLTRWQKLRKALTTPFAYVYFNNICYYFNYEEYKRYIFAKEIYKISENIAREYPELI